MTLVRKKKRGSTLALILAVVGFVLLMKVLLFGNNVALLNPKGLIAQQQMNLMLFTVGLLLVAAIPALFLFYFFAWKYRESNKKAGYDPGHRPKGFDLAAWGIPAAFMLVLALVMWPAAHQLDPKRAIAADVKPLTVQVVALRWKWLFIYPEQDIATVNFLQIPVDTPVRFELTADDMPMSSFWIPNLGGMLYAMTGHVNRLNLMAETAGDYPGSSAEINGAGFADMKFTTRASSKADFDQWVHEVQTSPQTLDEATYEGLLKPSEHHAVGYYSSPLGGLYDKVLMKYSGGHGDMHMEGQAE